jgi:signal transduction histidine kinase/DNA-binding response OmpR family regulator
MILFYTLMKNSISIAILFFLSFKVLFAQDITIADKVKRPVNITTSVSIFRDTTASLSLDQVKSQKFVKSKKDHFLFPFTNDIFWVRLTIKNTDSKNKTWILLWSNPLVEELDFYVADNPEMQNFTHKHQRLITSERDKPFIDQDIKFNFDLENNQTKTIYLKLTWKRGHYGMLRLYTPEEYTKFRMDDFSGQGFLNGLVFFRLFLVLILSFFIIKDTPFRLYSVYTVVKTFAYWGYLNIAGPLFSSNPDIAKKIDFICYNSVTVGVGIFILFGLLKYKVLRFHSFLIIATSAFTIFINVIIIFDYQWYWLKAGVYALIFSSFYYTILCTYFIVKKIPFAKYYSFLFILGLLSTFLLYTRLLGWLEIEPIYKASYYFFFAEFFFFVFFLGRIFRNTELNKKLTEQQLSLNIEQNNKLKELDNIKTQFFTNISHELRTPLTLLTAPIQELLVRYPTDSLLPLMNRNAQRLMTLINQLLDISKLEAGQMTLEMVKTNVPKYLNTLVASFTSLADSKNITFLFTQNIQTAEGYIDQDKIDKIINNLISNAIKFTPEGGQVQVNSHISADEKSLTLTIADTGIGIPEEKLPKIFDRFYQVDGSVNRKYEGTGIGLALVKELVEVLKGSISLESALGKGTTFMIKLPIDYDTWKNNIVEAAQQPMSQQAVLAVDSEASPLLASLTDEADVLLIVDDNADIRAYIRSIFESSYQIVEAANGREGIEKAQEITPNLIISDLMMPEMDGFEFCEYLKTNELTSHIPVIMLTAKANIESRIEGLELGADDYLIKPFNAKEIQVRVKNLIEKQLKLQEYFGNNSIDLKPSEVKVNSMDVEFINKAKEVLEKHLANKDFGAEEFAKEMALSQKQFLRKLKALTNLTINEFIRDFRLQRAAYLLSEKSANISEIAFQVGYESLSYFAKTFKEKYGKLPSEY